MEQLSKENKEKFERFAVKWLEEFKIIAEGSEKSITGVRLWIEGGLIKDDDLEYSIKQAIMSFEQAVERFVLSQKEHMLNLFCGLKIDEGGDYGFKR